MTISDLFGGLMITFSSVVIIFVLYTLGQLIGESLRKVWKPSPKDVTDATMSRIAAITAADRDYFRTYEAFLREEDPQWFRRMQETQK